MDTHRSSSTVRGPSRGAVAPSPGGAVKTPPGGALHSRPGGQRGGGDFTAPDPGKAATFRRGGTAGVATALLILIVLAFFISCALGTRPGCGSGTQFIFFKKTCVCVRACGHERGATAEPSAVKCPSLPACSGTVRGSWEMGAWGALRCTLESRTGGAGERGTSSCITDGERRGQAALFFFLAWAACAGCAGGAAAEAEGFLDQPTRPGRGGGAG